MVIITASLLYFLSLIDFIPEFILGLGILDDAIALKYVIFNLTKELKQYKHWRDINASSKNSSI